MIQTFKPYSEIPLILEQAAHKNKHISSTLKEYILQFSGDFSQLKEKLQKLSQDPVVSLDRQDESEVHSELFKAFPYIAVEHLLQIPSYETAAEELKKFATEKIDCVSNEYDKRNSSLRQQFAEELAKYENIRNKNDEASLAYKEAGILLQNAEKQNSPDIPNLQKDFVEKREKAIETYHECCTETEEITQNMEIMLTNFEELEIWRADQLKNILLEFSQTLMSIANNFVFASAAMNEAVSQIPIERDSHVIAQFDTIRPAETNDFFEVWSINPLATKFMSKKLLFKDEVANGGQLYQIKENYSGPGGHLNGIEGEIVCGLEERDDCVYCKNINDSVGLIPKRILESLQ